MTARKLPSGSYRAQVYDYTDNEGKKHYKSFTASTKREAERLANEFLQNKESADLLELTVAEAIEGYISSKEAVLSPSTIKAYRSMQHNAYGLISGKKIGKLNSYELQVFISRLTEDHSPKSVANIYGLLSSSLAMYLPDKSFHVSLPKRIAKRPEAPSDNDVRTLYEAAHEKLKKTIALAAFCSLRRGEICALRFGDMDGNILKVHADVVQNSDKEWVYKDMPKTADSVRIVKLPGQLVKLLGSGAPDQSLVGWSTPNALSDSYNRLRRRLGVSIRFHDLRHYFASIGAVLGIPDVYLSDFGGWKRGSSIMKEVYQNNIKSLSDFYSDKMSDHFEEIMS